MDNLVEAQVHLLVTEDEINRVRAPHDDEFFGLDEGLDDPILLFPNVGKLMNGIRNFAKCMFDFLCVTMSCFQVLSLCCESMPVFNNLKSFLRIKSDKKRGWQAMPVLLRSCPRLETLGLLHHEKDKCGDACDCIIREDKGLSLASCPATMLEIQGFLGTMKDMALIKHFLDNFQCLKEMEIFVEEDEPTELRVPEVAMLIPQMIEVYNSLSSCNVQLLVSDYLSKKWAAKGSL
uniref:FBD domain-containing protein n=1 Tax=Brassica oleracea TaxID=3712 RepID=A0A3P6FXF0_BRAOL|nr:unnamed protein product [Brassica oleracea]